MAGTIDRSERVVDVWAGRLALRSHIVLDQEFSFLFWWVSVRRVRRVPPPPVKPFRRIAASFFFPPRFLIVICRLRFVFGYREVRIASGKCRGSPS